MAVHSEEKLPGGELPQLATRLQRLPAHVRHPNLHHMVEPLWRSRGAITELFGGVNCFEVFKKQVLAMVIACLCHDLDHRGTNNKFQVSHTLELNANGNEISIICYRRRQRTRWLSSTPPQSWSSTTSTSA